MTSPEPINLLAIDTSSAELRLGLRSRGDRTTQIRETVGRSHGELLIQKIAELLKSAAVDRTDLGAIIVCIGPGSFTGLRIGLAAAKGMAMALEIPVIGVDLFEVAAHCLRSLAGGAWVIIPLNREECIQARVEAGRCDRDSVRVTPYSRLAESIGGHRVVGIGIDPAVTFGVEGSGVVADQIDYEASDLIHLGVIKLGSGYHVEPADLEPLYFQKSRAEILFEQRRRKR